MKMHQVTAKNEPLFFRKVGGGGGEEVCVIKSLRIHSKNYFPLDNFLSPV